VVEVNGAEYVAARRLVAGRPALDVLAELLGSVVADLHSPGTNMRWRSPGLSFSRPVRWVMALLDDQVVPVAVSDLTAGRSTHVFRDDPSPVRVVADAGGYLATLEGAGIAVDAADRRRLIRSVAEKLAADAGGSAELEGGLLDEVTNLVEYPNPILGRFDPAYLELPPEILVTVMRRHQRYFPVRGEEGTLLPAFIAVANGSCDAEVVRAGNESVLRARYEDARFFWNEDLRRRPDDFRKDLYRLTFADKLGSIGDRADRIASTAVKLADDGTLEGGDRGTVERAAGLAKFDLATQMVTELTSLAGTMAREYAWRAGEPAPVADALFEMELPRHSSDALPGTVPGALLSVADRADLLAGLFATGAEPTGSSDPFGLRRAALGLLSVLAAHPQLEAVTVERALDTAGASQPVEWTADARRRALGFVARRWETQQLDAGRAPEPVRAVLPRFSTPAVAERTLSWLVAHLADPGFAEVARALGRAARIVPAGTPAGWDDSLPADDAEVALREAVSELATVVAGGDLSSFVEYARTLVGPIDRFFEEVLVMVDDAGVRANRLGLLATIRDAAQSFMDWTQLG
jgi:glycyl-tRNA synthetase